MNYTYDSIGELKTAIGKESTGTTNRMLEQFGYTYDPAGNLIYRTNNTLLQQFNLNSLNELTDATNSGKLTVAGTTTSRATSVTVNSANSILYVDNSFASTNQSWANGNNTYTAIAQDGYGRKDTNVVSVNLQNTNTYAYDSNGNMLTNGTRVFEYDDENQLIRITEPGTWKSEFTYDGKMRRRVRMEYAWNGSSWLQTNKVYYVYDGSLVIQERDSGDLPKVTYTRGRDMSGSLQTSGGIGGLLARTDMTLWILGSGSDHAFYHTDGNGNITALIFTNQTMAAKYEYDPYGNVQGEGGSLGEVNLYRYSSKEQHVPSGLNYYLYRYYAGDLQRWLTRDLLGEVGFEVTRDGVLEINGAAFLEYRANSNPYRFLVNDPINRIDALGLLPERQLDPDNPDPNAFGHWKKPKPTHPFDVTCPDDRADLRDCFKEAQAYDNAVFKKSGDYLSSEEFNEVVEACMKKKGHIFPPR